MTLFIIIAILIVFSVTLYGSYIPYRLHSGAEKAGLGKFSFKYLWYKLHKIPVNKLIDRFEKFVDTGYDIDFDNFIKYYNINPDRFFNLTKSLTTLNQSFQGLSFTDIMEISPKEEDLPKVAETLYISKTKSISLSKEEILYLATTKFNLNDFFNLVEIAKKYNIIFTITEISDHNFDEFDKWINILLNSNEVLKISDNPLTANNQLPLSKKINITEAFLSLKNVNYEINIKDFIRHEEKGGNSKNVSDALIKIKNAGLDTEQTVIFEKDLQKIDLNNIVDRLIYPYELIAEPSIDVILSDGIQITPRIAISLKNKTIDFNTAKEFQMLFQSVNKTAHEIISTYKTYKDVLNHITKISTDINVAIQTYPVIQQNPFFSIDSIYLKDINITADKLISIKELENIEKQNDLKIKILEEKRKYAEELNNAFKSGELSYKDYQKEKYIFNSDDDSDLPYHTQ
jgi:uncharacterized protein YqfA (UPF0365 family)